MTVFDTTDNLQIDGTGTKNVADNKYHGQTTKTDKQNKTRWFDENVRRQERFGKI